MPMTPEIGSLWECRDGRKFRVEGVNPGVTINQKIRRGVRLSVLNPRVRQRTKTTIDAEYFGDGDNWCKFLRPLRKKPEVA